MNGKEYLEQIRNLDDKINNKILEKESLFTMVTHITPTLSDMKVQTSHTQDKNGDLIAKMVDLEEEINHYIDEFVDLKCKIISQLESLTDNRYYNLLHKRYVQYKKLKQIADEMGYSEEYVRELHCDALKAFESTYTNLHAEYVILNE